MTMQAYPSNGGILMQDKCIYNAQPVILPMPDQTLNDDILFSTFNLHFCNHCCLGFGALYNSVKARDSRMLGNYAKARSYGTTARRMNIAAVVIGFIFFIGFIFILFKMSSGLTSAFHHLTTTPGN
ncbi:interferon-induced transmembrane protein 1 [Megalobrama amblycephala]|uniref:interferon-induced transmembrane protein 1 n=1 Tax=Megalobrama amblycephala TaxID=75352 RepID=UPI002013DC5E|nr:interferon-induced transmembrane protein 1 [Megalobrama amblycephala]